MVHCVHAALRHVIAAAVLSASNSYTCVACRASRARDSRYMAARDLSFSHDRAIINRADDSRQSLQSSDQL